MIKNNIYSNLTEFELVDLSLNENTEAFGELYDRNSSKVYNKCIQLVKSKEYAEDLTHDVFVKAFLRLRNFKKEAQFSTWIHSITYNICINYLRKEKKLSIFYDYEIQNIEDIPEDTEEISLHQINAKKLMGLLEQIRIKDKIILLMKYQDDLSIKEISEILQIRESATKMRIKRAKDAIYYLNNSKEKP